MDQGRFDDLARALATPRSRRGFLGTIAVTVAAAFTGAGAAAAPPGGKPSKCYGAGSRCTNGNQCCSGTCTNRACAPAPVCDPGAVEACYSGPVETLNVGVCQAGTKTCYTDGSGWGECTGQVLPGPETCNGSDDDCDGVIDESSECVPQVCAPGSTEPCYTGPAGTKDVGICHGGTRTCDQDGKGWGDCENETVPGTETTCNGLDEDCDGSEDNGVVCPTSPNADGACVGGQCQMICQYGFDNCNGDDPDGCECPTHEGALCLEGRCCIPPYAYAHETIPCCEWELEGLCYPNP